MHFSEEFGGKSNEMQNTMPMHETLKMPGSEKGLTGIFKRLGKDGLIYGVGGALARSIGFFMFPVYTRIFEPAEYGKIELLTALTGMFSSLYFLGIDYSQNYFFCQAKLEKEKNLVSSAVFWYLFIWGLMLSSISILLYNSINSAFFRSNLIQGEYILACFFLFFNVIASNSAGLFRLLFRPYGYLAASLGQSIISSSFIIYFIWIMKLGVAGYFAGMLIGAVVISVSTLFFLSKWLTRKFSWDAFKKCLKYGIPLFPTTFILYLFGVVDKYFIAQFLTLDDVGIYAAGLKLSNILALGVISFRQAWTPISITVSHREDAQRFYGMVCMGYICIGSVIAIFFQSIAFPLLKILVNTSYLEAYQVVGYLVYNAIFLGFYYIAGIGILLKEKTHLLSLAMVASLITTVLMNYLLIPMLGMIGAALSTLFGHLLGCIIALYFSQQLLPLGIRIWRILAVFVITIASIQTQVCILNLLGSHFLIKSSIFVLICGISFLLIGVAGFHYRDIRDIHSIVIRKLMIVKKQR